MAMVRLPTRASDGKANLHQGAIGVGIDIARGETLRGVAGTEIVDEHPDTLNPISGIKVPGWDSILELAAGTYELTKLGYMGVDIVLDRDRGPLILELNARPGLSIQIANHCGLHGRLREVEGLDGAARSAAERAAYAREHFGVQGRRQWPGHGPGRRVRSRTTPGSREPGRTSRVERIVPAAGQTNDARVPAATRDRSEP